MHSSLTCCTGGLCAAADNKIHRFALHPKEQLLQLQGTLEVKQQGIADLAIRQDQRIFASAGWDSKIRIFNYAKFKPLANLQVCLLVPIEQSYLQLIELVHASLQQVILTLPCM